MIWRHVFQPMWEEALLGAGWDCREDQGHFPSLNPGLLTCFYNKCRQLCIYFNIISLFFLSSVDALSPRSFYHYIKDLIFAVTDRCCKLSINSSSQIQISVLCRFITHPWSPHGANSSHPGVQSLDQKQTTLETSSEVRCLSSYRGRLRGRKRQGQS